jgi:hypothetical protein
MVTRHPQGCCKHPEGDERGDDELFQLWPGQSLYGFLAQTETLVSKAMTERFKYASQAIQRYRWYEKTQSGLCYIPQSMMEANTSYLRRSAPNWPTDRPYNDHVSQFEFVYFVSTFAELCFSYSSLVTILASYWLNS